MLGGWSLAAIAGLSLGSMLVAAKTHGRHLRLEREQAGFVDVDVRSDDAPEWVDQLWKTDRSGFWRLFPLMAILGALIALPVPASSSAYRVALVGVGAVLWGFTATFLFQGARSWIRLDRATDKRRPNLRWWNSLHVATWFYWTSTLVLLAGAFFLIATYWNA